MLCEPQRSIIVISKDGKIVKVVGLITSLAIFICGPVDLVENQSTSHQLPKSLKVDPVLIQNV